MKASQSVTWLVLLGLGGVTGCGKSQGTADGSGGSLGPTTEPPGTGTIGGRESVQGGSSGAPAAIPGTSGRDGGAGEGTTHGGRDAGSGGSSGDAGQAGEAGAPNGLDANAPLSFAAPVHYAGGAWAMDIGVADLNGDGALDVASADFEDVDAGAFVWLNQGDGTFRAASPYLLGQHATSIALGDFNDDDKPELLVGGPDDLSMLLNNGDGTFSAPAQLSTAGYGLQVLDANGDAKLDFVAGTSLFLNQGDAVFRASVTNLFGMAWVATDLNGDRKTDVVGAGGRLYVSLNSGGAFAPSVSYETGRQGQGSTVRGSAVGDVNRDGWPDIAAPNDQDASAAVLLNQGDGTFSAPRVYPTGAWPTSAALGDLNGDGWPELVVANSGSGNSSSERPRYLGVYRNLGDGTFETPEEFLLVEFPYSVTLADLNGDNKLDIAVGDLGGRLCVVLNATH